MNPLLFFTSNEKIIECKDEMFKYRLRVEAANSVGGKVYLA
jgi:hypothetical protein